VTLKQQITKSLSVQLNLNNISNSQDGRTIADRVTGWMLPDVNNKYGMTADFGVRLEL
jgi:hypothetical protein